MLQSLQWLPSREQESNRHWPPSPLYWSLRWLAGSHAESLRQFIDHHAIEGVIVYIILNLLDAVIAPGATLPLFPIAARAWGRVPAALITTVGWTAESFVAFYIARHWDRRF